MKLITNFKDYYDYIIGKYGIDEKAVYVRTCSHKPYHIQSYDVHYANYIIAFCGTLYCIYWYEGKFYYGDEYKDIPKNEYTKDLYSGWRGHGDSVSAHLKPTDANNKNNCPVILLSLEHNKSYKYQWDEGILNPRLSDYGFASLIPPEEAFIQITNFLLREKEIVDNRTDKVKITANGFDLKTSFRKM